RSTGKEVELVEIARQGLGQLTGELFHGAVRERAGRDIAELAGLRRQRAGHFGVRVADVRHVRAADRAQVVFALLVVHPAPLAAHDAGVAATELPVEDVAVGIAVRRHSSPCFSAAVGSRKATTPGGARRASPVRLASAQGPPYFSCSSTPADSA